MRIDWKYAATMLAAIAGVAVPVWLWQWDLRAKSLTVTNLSSADLQTPATVTLPDLKLTIAGEVVEAPVLTTIELVNDGAKPIASSDFEAALELSVVEPITVVRARVASAEPSDLAPEITVLPRSIKLKPLLLNPDDKIRLTVLTSGPSPTFYTRARIAGVGSVGVKQVQGVRGKLWSIVMTSIAATGGFILYFVFGAALAPDSRSRLPRMLSASAMLALGVLSSMAVKRAFELAEVPRELSVLWPVLVVGAALGVVVSYLSRRYFRRVAGREMAG